MFAADTAMNVDTMTIEVLTLADRKRKIVARGGHSPRYLSTSGESGYLIYTNRAALFAIPFDLETLETRGTAVRMLDDVAHNSLNKNGQFDVSRTGTLVYRRASGEASAQMTRCNGSIPPAGRNRCGPIPARIEQPSLSPDGKRVALTISEGGNRDVWVFDAQRDALTRFTFGGYNIEPNVEPGRPVRRVLDAWQRPLSGPRGWSQPAASADADEDVLEAVVVHPGWQTTGVFRNRVSELGEYSRRCRWWSRAVSGRGGEPEPFSRNSYAERLPSFSPDGRWLAYDSDESGRTEVYVRAFPSPSSGQGGKWQISNRGGSGARWSRSGPAAVYRSGDQVMAVRYKIMGDTFVGEKPRVWIAKLGGSEWDRCRMAGVWRC